MSEPKPVTIDYSSDVAFVLQVAAQDREENETIIKILGYVVKELHDIKEELKEVHNDRPK